MRLDVWLNKVCLVRSRSQAKSGCQSDKILLGGESVKESRALREGDELTLHLPGKVMELRVIALPDGNVSRKSAPDYYEILSETIVDARDI